MGDRSKGRRLQIKRRNKRLIMHPARRAGKIQSGDDVVFSFASFHCIRLILAILREHGRTSHGAERHLNGEVYKAS